MNKDFELIKEYLIERVNLDATKGGGGGVSAFMDAGREIKLKAKNTEVLMALARLETVINKEGK
jgi:hypothetical protein